MSSVLTMLTSGVIGCGVALLAAMGITYYAGNTEAERVSFVQNGEQVGDDIDSIPADGDFAIYGDPSVGKYQ